MAITNRALAFASRWFDEAIVSRTFEPLIADWQREWQDTTPSRRWWVSVRALSAFIVATLVSSPRIVLTPASSSVTHRIVTRVARFTLLATVILIVPSVMQIDATWRNSLLLLFLVPGALVVAFPFAMIGAVDAIRCDAALPSHVERAAAVKLGITAVLLMVCCHGWVMPAANQAWRTETWRMSLKADAKRTAPARGVRELTTLELIVDPSRAHAGETTNAGGRAAVIRRELNNRASLAVLPVFFLWMRWRALDLPRRRWSPLPAGVATVAIIGGFVLSRWSDRIVEDLLSLRPGTGLWLPFFVLAAVGLVEQWLGHRARRIEATA